MSKPLSENAILACLDKYFPNCGRGIELGRGDDCAIIAPGGQFCVTSDLFLEDIHFRRAYFPPEAVGHKSLAVNLSDLAASGARPLAFSLCLGVPEWTDMAWLNAFFEGMARLAQTCAIALCGGDISRSASLHIAISAYGVAQDGCGFVRRSAPLAGDALFVLGDLGLSRLALRELENGADARQLYPAAWRAHLYPLPRVREGIELAKAARAMSRISLMDVSDGIAADLPRLLGPGLGAELTLEEAGLHPELIAWCKAGGGHPILEALQGGEDYALLGACPPVAMAGLRARIPGLWQLGTVSANAEIKCNGQQLTGLGGYDHFASGTRKRT